MDVTEKQQIDKKNEKQTRQRIRSAISKDVAAISFRQPP
jgi:hypothetical protein